MNVRTVLESLRAIERLARDARDAVNNGDSTELQLCLSEMKNEIEVIEEEND